MTSSPLPSIMIRKTQHIPSMTNIHPSRAFHSSTRGVLNLPIFKNPNFNQKLIWRAPLSISIPLFFWAFHTNCRKQVSIIAAMHQVSLPFLTLCTSCNSRSDEDPSPLHCSLGGCGTPGITQHDMDKILKTKRCWTLFCNNQIIIADCRCSGEAPDGRDSGKCCTPSNCFHSLGRYSCTHSSWADVGLLSISSIFNRHHLIFTCSQIQDSSQDRHTPYYHCWHCCCFHDPLVAGLCWNSNNIRPIYDSSFMRTQKKTISCIK